MSAADQQDKEAGGQVLLGQRCVAVHHGMLWVDARIAKILGLAENQVLPDPSKEDEPDPEARRGRPLVELTPIVRVRPSRRGWLVLASVCAAFALLWGVEAQRLWSRKESPREAVVIRPPGTPGTPATPAPAEPQVRLLQDENGAVVEIRGAHPRQVLDAFCALDRWPARRSALGIAPASPPQAGLVQGRFIEDGIHEQSSVPVYFDPRNARWTIAVAP